MKRTILTFSGIAIAIFFVFEISKYSLLGSGGNKEFMIFITAILFIAIGYVLQQFMSKKEKLPSKDVIDQKEAIKKSGLSKQEYKILTLMAEGLSNGEIASQLFIQESTVKSHITKIFSKLDAKRRTEAIKIGREMQII